MTDLQEKLDAAKAARDAAYDAYADAYADAARDAAWAAYDDAWAAYDAVVAYAKADNAKMRAAIISELRAELHAAVDNMEL